MADVRYFVYAGEGTYTKISADKKVYQFSKNTSVAVENRDDQMKFAGSRSFYESDVDGEPLVGGSLPSNNPKDPISYTKVTAKKVAQAAPSVPAVTNEAPAKEDAIDTKEDSKKSKKENKKNKK